MAFHPHPQLIRYLFNGNRFGPPRTVKLASPWPWVDHFGFGSYRTRLVAHFGLAFASAPRLKRLTLPRTSNSPDHYAKGTPSAAPGPKSRLSLRPLVSTWFQVLFHSPPGVLFTFPSRYWFTIGRQRVFSLGGWSLRIPAGFHVSRSTWERARGSQHAFVYRTFTVCGQPSQAVRLASWFLTPRLCCPESEHAPRHRRRNAGRLDAPLGLGYSPFARRY